MSMKLDFSLERKILEDLVRSFDIYNFQPLIENKCPGVLTVLEPLEEPEKVSKRHKARLYFDYRDGSPVLEVNGLPEYNHQIAEALIPLAQKYHFNVEFKGD